MNHKKKLRRNAPRSAASLRLEPPKPPSSLNGKPRVVDPVELLLRRTQHMLSSQERQQVLILQRLDQFSREVSRLSRQITQQTLAAQSASSVAKTLSREVAKLVTHRANATELRDRLLDSASFAFEVARAPRSKGEPGLDHEPRDSDAARLYHELKDALAVAFGIRPLIPATFDPTRAHYRVVLTDVAEDNNLVEVEAPAFALEDDADRFVILRQAKAVLHRYSLPTNNHHEETSDS